LITQQNLMEMELERNNHFNSQIEENSIVKFNVGGYFYQTTRETLVGSPFLITLLEGKIPTKKDETGAIFIDRDGQYFSVILEYLRTREVVVPPNLTRSSILREMAFYCISLDDNYLVNYPCIDDGIYFQVNPNKENDCYFYFMKERNLVLCQSYRTNLPQWGIESEFEGNCIITIEPSTVGNRLLFLNSLLYISSKPCQFRTGTIGTYILNSIYKDKEDRCIVFRNDSNLAFYEKQYGWSNCLFLENNRKNFIFEIERKKVFISYWIAVFGSVLVLINDRQVGSIFLTDI